MASPGTPYTPTALATPVVAAAAAGVGMAATDIPYVSPSEYLNYPTAMSVQDLVPDGDGAAQQAALYDLLVQAADLADHYMFGPTLATSGASLRATLSVAMDSVPLVNGELKLICDFKPLLEVRGIDVGVLPSALDSVGDSIAAAVRLGRRTIYVPYALPVLPNARRSFGTVPPGQGLTVAWSYVSGYPHSKLTTAITGGSACALQATDGGTGLLGVYPGKTIFRIADGPRSEVFTVQSVAGSVVTATAPFKFAHALPDAPDFIPVTAIPPNARLANTYLVTALLKTRGDSAVFLSEMSEPRARQRKVGDMPADFALACKMLDRYVVRLKSPR